jgi:hypothetical protein
MGECNEIFASDFFPLGRAYCPVPDRPCIAREQGYPTRPIRMVVGFAFLGTRRTALGVGPSLCVPAALSSGLRPVMLRVRRSTRRFWLRKHTDAAQAPELRPLRVTAIADEILRGSRLELQYRGRPGDSTMPHARDLLRHSLRHRHRHGRTSRGFPRATLASLPRPP